MALKDNEFYGVAPDVARSIHSEILQDMESRRWSGHRHGLTTLLKRNQEFNAICWELIDRLGGWEFYEGIANKYALNNQTKVIPQLKHLVKNQDGTVYILRMADMQINPISEANAAAVVQHTRHVSRMDTWQFPSGRQVVFAYFAELNEFYY